MKNSSQWEIQEKPRIIYSNGICLVVLFPNTIFEDFIDIKDTIFEEDGVGFGIE